jgi:dienelactone hydrolase
MLFHKGAQRVAFLGQWLMNLLLSLALCFAGDVPETVHFQSEDHKTKLVAYLFEPSTTGPHAAIVLLHGRMGAYSSAANGVYTAATLSKRHRQWGEFWAVRGYLALLVDSFGPRGYPGGFGKGSYEDRPAAVSEQTVRPLDAYGALRYLRGRNDVIKDRIGVQGWSNGGMTVLVTLSGRSPGIEHPTRGEEVSPKRCEEFAVRNSIENIAYQGAEHNFDDPEKSKQENPADRRAAADAMRRAEAFFAANLQ